MNVCFSNRQIFYKICRLYFDTLKVKPVIAEIGVLKGDNAGIIFKSLAPKRFFLIDQWKAYDKEFGDSNSYHYKYLNESSEDKEKVERYYGGSLSSQKTFDNLHQKVENAFSGMDGIEVIRKDSIEAYYFLKEREPGLLLDFCYIDANHSFESVFNDLMYYKDILKSEGIVQLNDCCHSDAGVKQNLGVLEATIKFCKLSGFKPIAITNTDWSDVILMDSKNQYIEIVDKIIEKSDVSFVEIPDSLLGAARNVGARKQLSFK